MHHVFSEREEIAHAITHLIGAVLSIVALVLLIIYSAAGGSLTIVSAAVFGGTMLLMYIASTVVHSLPAGKWKDIFLFIDHAAIYLFIAGTYTPLLLLELTGAFGWSLFGIVWGLAFIGIILKIFFVKRFVFLSTLFYILMGWLIVIAWKPLTATMHAHGTMLLVIGGVIYTVGSLFYIWRKMPYHHVIWHVFVLFGSCFHFLSIFFYVI